MNVLSERQMSDRGLTGKNGKIFILNQLLKMEYIMKELRGKENV